MAGLIHFPTSSRSRRSRAVTRRTLMLGAAGYAATSLAPRVSAQDVATPEGTPGEISEPVAGLFKGEARQRLTSLLTLVPAPLLNVPDPNIWLFNWLDLQTHLTSLGNPDPFASTTNIAAIMSPLVSSDPMYQFAMVEEARKTFGFSVLEVHQTLVIGSAPDQVTFYAGGLPVTDLPAAWEAAGYTRSEGEAGAYWTAGENGEVDLNSPIGQFGTGRMNNVAILQDEIVVFTHTAEQLQQVQAFSGGGSSAADNEELAALIAVMPEDAVNVIGVQGAGLEAHSITPENPGGPLNKTTQDLLAESDDAVGPMPRLDMAFFGITVGMAAEDSPTPAATPAAQGASDAVFFVNLLAASGEEAGAVARVVAWRMEHMTSPVAGYVYSELFTPGYSGEDAVRGDVAALTFYPVNSDTAWSQMVTAQDLWPFVWLGEG